MRPRCSRTSASARARPTPARSPGPPTLIQVERVGTSIHSHSSSAGSAERCGKSAAQGCAVSTPAAPRRTAKRNSRAARRRRMKAGLPRATSFTTPSPSGVSNSDTPRFQEAVGSGRGASNQPWASASQRRARSRSTASAKSPR